MYTIGYIDFREGTLHSNRIVYKELDDARYNSNFTLCKVILENYNIELENELLYIISPMNSRTSISEKKININQYESLNFIKNDNYYIDIYYHKVHPGYLYTEEKHLHVYKFYINNHDDIQDNNKTPNTPSNHTPNIQRRTLPADPRCNPLLMKELTEKIKHINIQ